ELAGALADMDAGRLDEAKTRLEKLAALPSPSEERESARYSLAILLARPGSPGRDVSRARDLLEEVLADYPGAPREMGARLILSLLDAEESFRRQIDELRAQVAASGSESDDLKAALAQREAELRRIKEILLGRAGGS
ncbi:MAG TPA: hypothetical protein VNI57_01255, partial [Candidatus Saccharimonadales bacterium]|nr:hypothetical protein [Candidatus Saccharimonadales bacterium]